MADLLLTLRLTVKILDSAFAIARSLQEHNREAWFEESATTFKKIIAAKNPEERKNAVSHLASLWTDA